MRLRNQSDWFILSVKPVLLGDIQDHQSDQFLVPIRPALNHLDGREPSSQRVRRKGDGSQTKEALSVRNSGPSQLLISY
jgi:hypothetical protein